MWPASLMYILQISLPIASAMIDMRCEEADRQHSVANNTAGHEDRIRNGPHLNFTTWQLSALVAPIRQDVVWMTMFLAWHLQTI